MEEKKTKITLRLTEQQSRQLREIATESSMTISDCARNIIFRNLPPALGNNTEKIQQTNPLTNERLITLNKELIRLEHDIEMAQGMNKSYKTQLKERVDEIWHILN